MNHNKSQWLRVNKANPCPVCGKPDWCMITQDGSAVICARTESQKPAGNAGWLHRMGGYQPAPQLTAPVRRDIARAPAEVLDTTYRTLLDLLTLSDLHRDSLLKRGLSDQQIKTLGYRSMPAVTERKQVVHYLARQQITLQGVPGFCLDHRGQHWRLAGPHGIMIPVRSLDGRIAGIQIRCDNAVNGKYRWLSSSKHLRGCSSGVAVHVARPESYELEEVWITEGPLKADIASLHLQRIVLAIPGVASWKLAIPIIFKLKPQAAVVAFDMDKLTNETVNCYRIQLINYLLINKIPVYEANWNRKHKGIDDILID